MKTKFMYFAWAVAAALGAPVSQAHAQARAPLQCRAFGPAQESRGGGAPSGSAMTGFRAGLPRYESVALHALETIGEKSPGWFRALHGSAGRDESAKRFARTISALSGQYADVIRPIVSLIQENEQHRLSPDYADYRQIVEEEQVRLVASLTQALGAVRSRLIDLVLPEGDAVTIEIGRTAGGSLSPFDVLELTTMYRKYAESKRWTFAMLEDRGSRSIFRIEGARAYGYLMFEQGPHRFIRPGVLAARSGSEIFFTHVAQVSISRIDARDELRRLGLDLRPRAGRWTRDYDFAGNSINRANAERILNGDLEASIQARLNAALPAAIEALDRRLMAPGDFQLYP